MITTYQTGPRAGQRIAADRLQAEQQRAEQAEREQLADDLARWAGEEAEAAHDEAVASLPEGQHYTHCCMHAREDGARNEYAFAMGMPLDKLRARHASSLAERGGRS